MKEDHTHISHMNDSQKDIWSISDAEFKKLFEHIYYEYIDSLYRFAFFRLSNTEKATDLVQDVFIKYFAYLQKLRQADKKEGQASLNHRAILFQSSRNAIIDHYRVKKNYSLDALIEEEGNEELLSSDEDITIKTETEINFKHLKKHIVKLKPEQQEMIYMRYFEGLSVTEIALALSERENTVSVKLHRITESLKKSMNS